jgi:hypothetical protein
MIDWGGPATPTPHPSDTTTPIAPAPPGDLTVPTHPSSAPSVGTFQPVPAFQQQAAPPKDLGETIAQGIDGLGQTLFGRGNGSPLGGVPLLGDIVGAGGNLFHGMATNYAVKPFEAVAGAVSHIPLGGLPGGADENFNRIGEWAKTNSPQVYDQWMKVNTAAGGDVLGGGNLRADFNMEFAKMMDDQQYNSTLGTTPELAMGREGIGSVGGAFTHAVQGFLGILGNTSQRLLGGAGIFDPGTSSATYEQQKQRFDSGNMFGVGDEAQAVFAQLKAGTITETQARQQVETISKGGRNRVEEAASRLALGLQVSDVEKQAVEAWQSGAWSIDHAQDYLVSHGQSITRNPVGQIAGSLVTDPLTYATIGAGSVAKAGKVGAQIAEVAGEGSTLGERLATADTAYQKLAVAVREVQEKPLLGTAFRISRGLIDPLGVYKPSTVQRATTDLLAAASLSAFDRAYGPGVKEVEALAREFDKTPEVGSAIASYTQDQAHLMTSIHMQSTMLGEGLGEELAKTSVDEVIEPMVRQAGRDAITQLTDHMQSVAKNTFTAEEEANLAGRMAIVFGKDVPYWEKRLPTMSFNARSALHAITYKASEAEFERARALIDTAAYKGDLPIGNLVLMAPETLDDVAANDIVEGIQGILKDAETPDKIAAATGIWNREARRYPAMATIGYAPGGKEQVEALVHELDRQVKVGAITRRALDKELNDPGLRPIRDMLDRHSTPLGGPMTFMKADGLDPKPLMDEFGWTQAKVQELIDNSEMMPTKMLEPLREIDRRAKPELSLHQSLDALQSDIAASGGIKSPIIVWWDPKTGAAVVADGNHRLTVALEQGWEHVPVVVETQPTAILAQAENVNSIAKLKPAAGAPTAGVLKPSQVFPGAKITPGVASVGEPGAAVAKQGFISVPEGTLPVGHGKIYKGDATQAGGAPVRGIDVISPEDPIIPDVVYHVTTNRPAVMRSGVLKAGGKGGLGGDEGDQIVSMTISKDVADQLAADMKLVATAYKDPHPVAVFTAQAQAEGWGEKWLKSNLFTPKGRPAAVTQKYSVKDWQIAYFNMRPDKQNPLIFGDALKGVNPKNIGIVKVPKASLKNGALLANFDIDGRTGGLQEIRSYGDVPLKAPAGGVVIPPPPPEAIEIPELGATSKPLWKVGFRPDEDVSWGLKRDAVTGKIAIDRAPTISHVVDAVPGRQRFSDTTRNFMGQIIGKSTAERLNQPIDSIEAYANTLRDVVTGRRLVNNIERRFERSTFDAGIPKPLSKEIMKAAKDIAGMNQTTLRGISPNNLWREIGVMIPKDFRLANGAALDIHTVMDHLLRASEGDMRIMGVTSNVTQRMRNAIQEKGVVGDQNVMGQLTVTQYNRMRYAFNPTFIIQRVTDSIYYSILYGVTPVGKGELHGAAAEMRAIEENMGRTATGRDFSMDMPEFATRQNFTDGIKDRMQQMGIREATVGKVSQAPNVFIANNMTNMLHARLGDIVRGALDNLATAAEKADPAFKAEMAGAGETLQRSFEDWRRVYSDGAGRVLDDNEVGLRYVQDMLNGWRRAVVNADGTLDFRQLIAEGERFLPSDVGEMVSIKPEVLAQDMGYPNALALRRDVMGHLEKINGTFMNINGEKDLPWLEEKLRTEYSAHPDYIKRVLAYFGNDWDGYFHQLSLPIGKGGLDITPHYAKQVQDVIAMWARDRGMDPWEYLSGVMAANIGPNDINSAVGQLVTFLKSGASKQPIEEWTKVFRSTLDTSAQQELIREFEKATPIESAIAAPKPGAFGIGTGGVAVPPAGYKAEAGYVYKVQTLAEARKGWARRTAVQTDADMRTVSGRPGEGVFRSKIDPTTLSIPRSTTGLDRLTRGLTRPDGIEMLDIHGNWVAVGKDPMDTIMAENFPEVVRQRLAGIADGTGTPHPNPEVEGYIQQFAKWYTETRAATLSQSTRHDLKRLTEAAQLAAMPTEHATPLQPHARPHRATPEGQDRQRPARRLPADGNADQAVRAGAVDEPPAVRPVPLQLHVGQGAPGDGEVPRQEPVRRDYVIADVQRAIAIQREYDHDIETRSARLIAPLARSSSTT